jgi:hypothetical protein
MFGEEYSLWSSSLCHLLRFPVALSPIDLNIFSSNSSAQSFLDRWVLKQSRLFCEGQLSVFVSTRITHDSGPLTNVKLKNANLLWRGKAVASF